MELHALLILPILFISRSPIEPTVHLYCLFGTSVTWAWPTTPVLSFRHKKKEKHDALWWTWDVISICCFGGQDIIPCTCIFHVLFCGQYRGYCNFDQGSISHLISASSTLVSYQSHRHTVLMLFMQRPKSEFSPLLQNHHLFIRALRIEPMEHELQVVSPYYFEVHAGSTKKHPSDYFLLENGNSLHDVLRAWTNATLDMLRSAIRKAQNATLDMLRSAILKAKGPAPQKRTFRCKACKSLLFLPSSIPCSACLIALSCTLRSGKFALFCDSCLESMGAKNNSR